ARLLLESDVLVGTSAGSTVVAQLGSGRSLDVLFDRQTAEASSEIDPGVDIEAITELFLDALQKPRDGVWNKTTSLARIGAVALATQTVPETVRREVIAQRLPSHEWPDRAL